MEIIKINLSENKPFNNNKAVACIGFFDGVHRLHEKILRKTKKVAKKNSADFVVITFSAKIRDYLKKTDTSIQSSKEKYEVFEKLFTPDFVYEIIVNDEVITKSSEFFMDYLKNILNVEKIIVGSDFRFGKGAAGTATDLINYFGNGNIIVFKRSKRYSSTKIRELLKEKDKKSVKKLSKNVIFK
jgi:riboflavin kinase/FMN adenylyltransferase